MRRISLSLILALAMVAGACGSDDDRPVDPERISLQIVSGDRQPARVADAAAASQAALPAGRSLQQLPDNLLPEPLVARIVVDGEPLTSRSSDPLGPSLATLPSDVVVTYRVIQPTGVGQRHCGDSFLSSAKPDKDGLVTTYWERGTYAGECRMEVRLVVDGQPRVDTAFVVEFEPGAIDWLQFVGVVHRIYDGDTLTVDLRSYIKAAGDAYGNEIPVASLRSLPDTHIGWAWFDGVVAEATPPSSPVGAGWLASLPPLYTFAERCSSMMGMDHSDGSYTSYAEACGKIAGLAVWIDGYSVGKMVHVGARTSCTIHEPSKAFPEICDWGG